MDVSLVLTVLGDDEPGIVERLSRTVRAHGGNWEESRMAQLAGCFAGLLRVTVPEARRDELLAALRGLDGALQVAVRPGRAAPPATVARLSLVGTDQPGIVEQVFHALAQHGVNVEVLETDRESAPMSGELLFRVRADLSVPPGVGLERVREALEAIAGHLMVDVELGA